ncbi:MAG: hypothetical protein LPK26_06890 [Bacillaceae bacterium]|nr:hypothetical protein [Bacillaceae bacterium]
MSDNNLDLYEHYKQLEEEWNNELISTLNCPEYVQLSGKVLEAHLDCVLDRRKNAEKWLKTMNVPTKNELAMMANIIIRLEHKTDDLEERMFSLLQSNKKQNQMLKELFIELRKMKTLLEKEGTLLQPKTKLELLQDELKDLLAN